MNSLPVAVWVSLQCCTPEMQTVGFAELQVFLAVSSIHQGSQGLVTSSSLWARQQRISVIPQIAVFNRGNFCFKHVVNHVSQFSCLQSMCKCLILGNINLTGNKGAKKELSWYPFRLKHGRSALFYANQNGQTTKLDCISLETEDIISGEEKKKGCMHNFVLQ